MAPKTKTGAGKSANLRPAYVRPVHTNTTRKDTYYYCKQCKGDTLYDRLKQGAKRMAKMSIQGHVAAAHPGNEENWEDFIGEKIKLERQYRFKAKVSKEQPAKNKTSVAAAAAASAALAHMNAWLDEEEDEDETETEADDPKDKDYVN